MNAYVLLGTLVMIVLKISMIVKLMLVIHVVHMETVMIWLMGEFISKNQPETINSLIGFIGKGALQTKTYFP